MSTKSAPPKVSGLVKKASPDAKPAREFRKIAAFDNAPSLGGTSTVDATETTPVIATDQLTGSQQVQRIQIQLLDDSPSQYRLIYPPDEIDELAQTLKVDQLEPIRVRPKADGRYEIISGHRRKRAAISLGLDALNAIVVLVDDKRAAVEVILANESHVGVGDFERAIGYQRLISLGFTQTQISEELGVNRSLISNRMRFFDLPRPVLEALDAYPRAFSHHTVPKLLAIIEESPDLIVDVAESTRRCGSADLTPAAMVSVLKQKQSKQNHVNQKPPHLSISDKYSRPMLTIQPLPKGKIEIQLDKSIDQEEFIRKLSELLRNQISETEQGNGNAQH